MKAYFGTDGIRGRANTFPMTPEVALRLGKAAGAYFKRGAHRHTVVLGKDTRLSGYMIEYALISGFASAGVDVRTLGPCPTPAIGLLTRSLRADLGVMITASHNAYSDNGIKLFGPDGFKLPDEAELEIEAMMDDPSSQLSAPPEEIGQVSLYPDAKGRYVEAAKATFAKDLTLNGVKVVVDCAHGAAYKTAPLALWELGAEVEVIGAAPNGTNINASCGSTSPDAMARKVLETGADLGIALDGDGDRLILCDETGRVIDGDQILARIGLDHKDRGMLRSDTVVATVMSNFTMERALSDSGVALERTAVGDRYVVERMREAGYNVGGEQSGHIVLTDHATTGDGLIAALQILSCCVRANKPASEVCSVFEPAPQVKVNVPYTDVSPLTLPQVQAACQSAEARLNGRGRLVVRASGTEPLIRVMTEGEDETLIRAIADDLAGAMRDATVIHAAE
ncbi:MAG: phosphoglucosamine mutase [Oceanicaulis sp.]